MKIPDAPYIGLYGSHSGPWRDRVIDRLKPLGIEHYDPTDERWKEINDENGDQKQALIDELVAQQHRGMLRAACIIFHLARYHTESKSEVAAFAARCELGFLTGRAVRTLVHLEPDVLGRNYLRGALKLYPHMTVFDTLEEAVENAIGYFRDRKSSS